MTPEGRKVERGPDVLVRSVNRVAVRLQQQLRRKSKNGHQQRPETKVPGMAAREGGDGGGGGEGKRGFCSPPGRLSGRIGLPGGSVAACRGRGSEAVGVLAEIAQNATVQE